jgi:uncharacterized membrane protein HdeD (DUF308 family)
MLYHIANNWRLFVLRGVIAIAFGVMALFWPQLTMEVLILLFAIYAILEGLLALAVAARRRGCGYGWLLVLEGVLGLGVGLCALTWPLLTAVVLLIFIAAWAILTGMLELATAIQLRRVLKGEWGLGLAGLLSIGVGILLLASPDAGVLAVVWLIGLYAIAFGALLAYLGLRLRRVVL